MQSQKFYSFFSVSRRMPPTSSATSCIRHFPALLLSIQPSQINWQLLEVCPYDHWIRLSIRFLQNFTAFEPPSTSTMVGNCDNSFEGLMTKPLRASCLAFMLTLNSWVGSVSLEILKTARLHSLALSLFSLRMARSFFCPLLSLRELLASRCLLTLSSVCRRASPSIRLGSRMNSFFMTMAMLPTLSFGLSGSISPSLILSFFYSNFSCFFLRFSFLRSSLVRNMGRMILELVSDVPTFWYWQSPPIESKLSRFNQLPLCTAASLPAVSVSSLTERDSRQCFPPSSSWSHHSTSGTSRLNCRLTFLLFLMTRIYCSWLPWLPPSWNTSIRLSASFRTSARCQLG